MALYNFHRVLIAAAIVFDAGFTWFSLRRWNRSGDQLDLIMAIASTIITISFVVYLVFFNRKTRRLQSMLAGQCVKCGADVQQQIKDGQQACGQCGQPIPMGTQGSKSG